QTGWRRRMDLDHAPEEGARLGRSLARLFLERRQRVGEGRVAPGLVDERGEVVDQHLRPREAAGAEAAAPPEASQPLGGPNRFVPHPDQARANLGELARGVEPLLLEVQIAP